MEKLISNDHLSLVKAKNEKARIRLTDLFTKFANDNIKVGTSLIDNDGYLSFILEAYLQDVEEDDYGVILSITFQKKDDFIEGEFSITKESGQFILSPRTFNVNDESVFNEFFDLLD